MAWTKSATPRPHALLVFAALLCAANLVQAVDLVGYVPYYRMNNDYVSNTLPAQLAMLDEVRYFGVTVESSGNLSTTAADLNNIQTIKTIIDGMPAAERPRLGITIGGAGTSGGFSAVAASATLRDRFAQNLDALLDQTGAGGVDLDWEHPSVGAERTTLYPAMLSRVKQEFGQGRRIYATVAPSVVVSNSIFEGPNAVDGVSLMTYDLGWWSNDPGNPNTGQHSLHEYAEDAVEAWTEPAGSANPRPWVFGVWGNDSPVDKLGVGLPFYGRGFNGSSADLAVTYRDLHSNGVTSDGSAYQYSGSNVWIPSLDLVEQRVQFAHAQGLQNLIIWELAQDLNPSDADSMLRTAYQTKLSLEPIPGDFDKNGKVDGDDLGVWQQAFGVDHGGDADADDDSDGRDFLIWQKQFDDSSATASAALAPEPATVGLASAVMWTLLLRRPLILRRLASGACF